MMFFLGCTLHDEFWFVSKTCMLGTQDKYNFLQKKIININTESEESKKISKVDTERRLRWRADMYMSAGGKQISYIETHRGLVSVY